MKIVSSLYNPIDNWNNNIEAAAGESGLLQTEFWATLLNKLDRAIPIYLKVSEEDELIASLLLFHKNDWDRLKMRKSGFFKSLITGKKNGWIEWNDGPVFYVDSNDKMQNALKLILEWIEKYISKHNILLVQNSRFSILSKWADSPLVKELFLQANYNVKKWATYLIDINRSENELLMNFDHSVRKNINKSKKMGVSIKKIDSFNEFKKLFIEKYNEFETSAGRKATNPEVFISMWINDIKSYYSYYVAFSESEVIATLGIYKCNGIITEIASSMSPKAFELKIPAQDLLHWEIFVDAKKEGYHTFDLAGVNPKPGTKKEEGIRRFKEKWGGKYVEYYIYSKTVPHLFTMTRTFILSRMLNNKKQE